MIIRTKTVKFFGYWLLIVLAWVGVYHAINNDYMTDRDVYVTVMDKMKIAGSKGSEHLAVVYKTDNGTVFDRYVSPSLYATSYVGDRYPISIRPFDIRQTPSQNLWFFFLPTIFLSFIATATFSMLIFGWSMLSNPIPKRDTSHRKPRTGGGFLE